MLIAAVLILALYVAPLAFVVWNIRDDFNAIDQDIGTDKMVAILTASLIPVVAWYFSYLIVTTKYDIPSPAVLWSRLVLWVLS